VRRRRQRGATPASPGGKRDRKASERRGARRDKAEGAGRAGNQAVEGLVERSRKKSPSSTDASQRAADDPAADAAAHLLEAEAATVQGHVIRSRDGPDPASAPGRRLLSHELVHVLQQRHARHLRPGVGAHDDPLEAAAAASTATERAGPASSSVPAMQREPRPGAEGQPESQPSRHPVVEQRLVAYLERVRDAQKGQSVRVTDEVRGDLRRLALGDVNTVLRLDAFLATIGPREPESMARAITRLLPDTFDPARSAYLESLPASEPPKSTLQRGIDLVKRTEPYVSPEAQQAQWEFDRRAKEARRNDDVIGPFGVDLQRAVNIAKGVPEVISPAPKKTVPKPLAETTESVVATLDDAELVPRAERGSARADEYAIASDVARDVARRIADAQRRKRDHIEIRLGANYKSAEDRFEILDALERIVRQVARSMPAGGDPVSEVQVYFGDLPIRRLRLNQGSVGGP
jgi:hypothetical protein